MRFQFQQPSDHFKQGCNTLIRCKLQNCLLKNLCISFDAEWEQSSGRVLSLRDDDSQSLIEGEWRKINTLNYYKVIKLSSPFICFKFTKENSVQTIIVAAVLTGLNR